MQVREQKRLVIGGIYVILAGLLLYGFFAWIRVEPTCFDQVQNGQEEGVDCGVLACSNTCDPEVLPLDVIEERVFKIRDGEYDFLARIRNPNLIYGAAKVPFQIEFKDAQGSVVGTDSGTLYVLPAQTRYFVKTSLRVSNPAAEAHLVLGTITWTKTNSTDLKIDFPLRRESFTSGGTPGAAHEYEAIISNNSDFDFAKVDISIILRDAAGQIVAVNGTDVRTLQSRTERYFKVTWPTAIGANLQAQVEGTTNVFENSNFIKRYGTQEQFQEF